MATAKPEQIPRVHRWRNAFLGVMLLVALGFGVFWHGLQARAVLAASYGARIACTCHYLGGRSLPDCRKDFEPGMALVMLSDDPVLHTVTARVPLIASQTATFRDGPGCSLQSWVS